MANMSIDIVTHHVLNLSTEDRIKLLSMLIRYVLETGELEASSLRTQISLIESGE